MRELTVNIPKRGYKIAVGKGLLSGVSEYFNLNRKVFIITDSGVPKEYAERVLDGCKDGIIYTVPIGECSKSIATFEEVLTSMLNFKMTRSDCVVAVGGGVVGDLSAFAAASYMRGIDFYNVPTTLLAAVDSSIGGKCGVNLAGIKNAVGAFFQPKGVLIDTDTLKTLTKRQFASGLAESIKMALTSDAELFSILSNNEVTDENIEEIIVRSLKIKADVVVQDEKESGLRKILNFGHTLGHGIEACEGLSGLYHGECVALGMLPLCADEIRECVKKTLALHTLPTEWQGDIDKALEFTTHDKKSDGGILSVITVNKIGKCNIERMTADEFKKLIKERF